MRVLVTVYLVTVWYLITVSYKLGMARHEHRSSMSLEMDVVHLKIAE